MDCWSCGSPAASALCGCGAPQPLPPKADAFSVLGLPRTFFLDAAVLEERFKDLNRKLHPDRWAQRGPKERRLSLEWTTAINDAARTLRDPIRRAAYLLKLEGLDVEKESGPGAMRLPPEVLEQVMEQREALAEAKATGDLGAVRALARAQQAAAEAMLASVAEALRRFESGSDRPALQNAASGLAALKYQQRFLDEVRAIELEALDRG